MNENVLISEVTKHLTGRTNDPPRSIEGDYTISVATVLRPRPDSMTVLSSFSITVLWGFPGPDFTLVFVSVKKCIKRNCFLMSRLFLSYVYD